MDPRVDKPVLFITHDLSRSGAPTVLLRFLRWLRAPATLPFELLVNGPRDAHPTSVAMALLDEASAVARLHMLDAATGRPENLEAIVQGAYRLIYANTSATADLLATLEAPGTPVACHVHELGLWIGTRLGRRFHAMAKKVDHFVACGASVRDNLVRALGLPADAVEVIPNGVAIPDIEAEARVRSRDSLRRDLGLPTETLLIAACGGLTWVKGVHVLVPLLQALRRTGIQRPYCLAWVTSDLHGEEYLSLRYQIEQAGVGPWVRLVSLEGPPAQVFGVSDLFVLLSMEDSFPLVMLEAAACGLPILGFERSGGVTEFVDETMGVLVPHSDVIAFAGQIARIAGDDDLRVRLGAQARHKVARAHDEAACFERFEAVVRRLAEGGGTRSI